MKTYLVTIKTTGYTYGNTDEVEVYASSASEAMKKARNDMYRNGHTRQDGPIKCTARVLK